jgi:hypothetical protein
MIDVAKLSDQQLKNIIANHRRQGATDRALYLEALEEEARRGGKGLDFNKSFEVIQYAAQEGRFVTYKELADASGADWNQVHYSMGKHLWSLVEYAYRRGWPMLSAIVVNKQNLATGRMDPDTLKGFIAAARDLDFSIVDEESFLREQQRRVFEWARNRPPLR